MIQGRRRRVVFLVVLLAIGYNTGDCRDANAQCAETVKVQESDKVLIRVDLTNPPIKRIAPGYFGFNLEWVGFQADLWNPNTGTVHPDVAMWLRKLSGATYRYPGGTVANFFQWRDAIAWNRRPQKAVDWTGPIGMQFGPEEYFRFLGDVGGQGWIVSNLYGEFDKELPIQQQAAEASAFSTVVDTVSKKSGVPVSRWELGNELDRGVNRWAPEKYAANANALSAAIRAVQAKAQFVAVWPDFDAFPGVPALEYARRLLGSLNPEIREFAQHMYFDGPPGGPPVPNRLQHMCRLIEAAKARGISPAVWVSEFGRWPPGKPSDPNWKLGFPLTANLASAISTADFLLGTSQIREIQGTMIHALSSSKGPWPMFHRHGEHFDPSAVLLSLVLLRNGLLGDVLPTEVASPYDAKTRNPIVRAAAVLSTDKRTVSITLVNRSETRTQARIAGVPVSGFSKKHIVSVLGIHDGSDLANNYSVGDRVAITLLSPQSLNLRKDANLFVDLFPNSITVLRLGL
jgi:alpha-L-arabinofuranosidase